ncbi:E3 ubiquitin-protein ligase RSL1-like [Aristolochia californica]|uniref:E3 ubiquitin-protein ligase RSL1-like n=1 Tax=Aristolochia californica TaxID=171875 RepID=UPI0035D77124
MDDELQTLVAEQQREIMAAKTVESDLDLAFTMQLLEAINASLADVPSSSSSVTVPLLHNPVDEQLPALMAVQVQELERFNQEMKDRELCQAEMRRVTFDLKRSAHDAKFALDVHLMPRQEWEEYGDNFERTIDEGTSSGPIVDEPFRLYFKGLVRTECVRGESIPLAAMGVAVCDPRDNLILKLQKPLSGSAVNHAVLEAKALIEGLDAALSLDIKRVNVFFDYVPLYNHVMGRWTAKQRKVANVISQVYCLIKKFEACRLILLPRCHVKHVYKLVRDAIDSQMTKPVGNAEGKGLRVICDICLEETEQSQIFIVDGCSHPFCFSCMRQHVEVKLLHGVLPECPHDDCHIKLTVASSEKFLTPKLLETMTQRIKEAAIPEPDRLYCPYPKCSFLMSRLAMGHTPQESSSAHRLLEKSGLRRCVKCNGFFCLNCMVPWHYNMSCYNYKRLHPHTEDEKVCNLAKRELWRQCAKCNHMIELAEGCFHMTCRCGYEFCYTCGAEWRNKKPTCSCPLWDEHYIVQDDEDSEGSDVYEDEDDDYDSEDDWY